MNAKKLISVLTLASAAALILAACGTTGASSNGASSAASSAALASSSSFTATTATRASAEGILDAMTTAVTAASYTFPTKYDVAYQASTTMTGAIHFSSADNFIYAKYVGSTVNYENVPVTSDIESWAFKAEDKDIVAVYTAGVGTYAEIDAAAFATLNTTYAAKASNTIKASPATFSNFLKNFDQGTQSTVTVNGSSEDVILAGGSSSGLWMKSEAYASTGAGNLTAALTIGRTYGDEPVVYQWASSRVVSEVNSASATTETFAWNSYTENTLDYSAYTKETDPAKIAALAAVVAAVAADF